MPACRSGLRAAALLALTLSSSGCMVGWSGHRNPEGISPILLAGAKWGTTSGKLDGYKTASGPANETHLDVGGVMHGVGLAASLGNFSYSLEHAGSLGARYSGFSVGPTLSYDVLSPVLRVYAGGARVGGKMALGEFGSSPYARFNAMERTYASGSASAWRATAGLDLYLNVFELRLEASHLATDKATINGRRYGMSGNCFLVEISMWGMFIWSDR